MQLLPLLLLAGLAALARSQEPPPPPPNPIKFINDLTNPGMPPMTLLDAVPEKLKAKIPPEIKEQMQKITSTQIKADIKELGKVLKKCMKEMMSPKECLEEIKKIDPEINKLLKMIKEKLKEKLKKLKEKLMEALKKLKEQLKSPVLKNIVQTAMDLMKPPPPSRRRKRASEIMDILKKLKEKPLTKEDLKAILKKIKEAIMKLLKMPPPPPAKSIMQMIVDMLAKMFPKLAPLLSNPSLMKALGTEPPPPPPPPPSSK